MERKETSKNFAGAICKNNDENDNIDDDGEYFIQNPFLKEFLEKNPKFNSALQKTDIKILDTVEDLEEQFKLLAMNNDRSEIVNNFAKERNEKEVQYFMELFTNTQCQENIRDIIQHKTIITGNTLWHIILWSAESLQHIVSLLKNTEYLTKKIEPNSTTFHLFDRIAKSANNNFSNHFEDIFGFENEDTNLFINLEKHLGVGYILADSLIDLFFNNLQELPPEKCRQFRNAFMGTKEHAKNIIDNLTHVLNLPIEKNTKNQIVWKFLKLDRCIDVLKTYNKNETDKLIALIQDPVFFNTWYDWEKEPTKLDLLIKFVDLCVKKSPNMRSTLQCLNKNSIYLKQGVPTCNPNSISNLIKNLSYI